MLAIQSLADIQLTHEKLQQLSLDVLRVSDLEVSTSASQPLASVGDETHTCSGPSTTADGEGEHRGQGGQAEEGCITDSTLTHSEEEKEEVMRDTLLQPNPCTLYKLQENGELLGMKDIVGEFLAFKQQIVLERTSPLIRRLSVGSYSIHIAEAPAHDIGGSIWLSSIAFCGWLAGEGRMEVCDKVVLELGSGVGVAGVFASSSCSPARLILSDGTPSLVGLCQFNVEHNRCAASCQRLDWGSDVIVGEEGKVDVILASDCIYRTNADAFLQAVLDHLRPGGKLFLINPPEENRTGIDEFIYKLWEHGELEWKRIRVEHDGYVKSLLFIKFERESLPPPSSSCFT